MVVMPLSSRCHNGKNTLINTPHSLNARETLVADENQNDDCDVKRPQRSVAVYVCVVTLKE